MAMPKLRFKNSKGKDYPKWEEKKLGDVATFHNGDRSSRYPKDSDIVSEGIAFLNTENLHSSMIDLKVKSKFITREKYNELSGAKLQLWDIAYCLRGSVGLCALNNELKEGTVASSLMLIRAKKNEINPIFLFYSLNSPYISKQTDKCLNGTCAGNLSAKDVSGFSELLPSLEEQEKIAFFLTELDNLISASNEEVKVLEDMKKGYMQKIFSQEIRFKADNGSAYPEWEEKQLGDVAKKIGSGKTKSKTNGKYILYGSTGPIGYTDKIEYIEPIILVARVGANAGKVSKVSEPCGVSDNTLVVSNIQDSVIGFLYNLLQHLNLNRLSFGSGQPLITGTMLKELMFLCPCLEEQQKIADFFTALDESIETAKQELEQYRQLKKAMLQQLFV